MGAEKLPGTKIIYYMRAANKARLFFRYSEKEKGEAEKLAESNKANLIKIKNKKWLII